MRICTDGIETRPYGYSPSEEKGDVVMKKESNDNEDKDIEIEDN